MSRTFLRSLFERMWIRRVSLLVGAVFLCVVVLETSPLLLYFVLHQRPFPRTEIQNRLLRASQDSTAPVREIAAVPDHVASGILHPYLGFTADPQSPWVNEFGFHSSKLFLERSSDRIIVALLGGSVALDMPSFLTKSFHDQAVARGAPTRRLDIINLAAGGYKQPQQLIALNYLLALGAEFDIVINLDGFNELALTSAENVPAGVYPFYPRSWNLYARRGFELDATLQIAEIHQIKRRRQDWSRLMSRQIFRNSNFSLLLWKTIDNRLLSRLGIADAELREELGKLPGSGRLGPTAEYESEEELLRHVAKVWKASSLQMARICEANDMDYYHFLQPNQYLPGSKPFSREEKMVAYLESSSARKPIESGYPLLVREGEHLIDRGVRFSDLTMLFRDEKRAVYVDPCCHFNPFGYGVMAERIVSEILDGL